MSWKDLACLLVVIIGLILFLYGSNYYNAVAGWGGLFLATLGIVLELVLETYAYVKKRGASGQKL